MIETIEAIRREVVVEVGRERAFELFTVDMTSWWPAAHHIGSARLEHRDLDAFGADASAMRGTFEEPGAWTATLAAYAGAAA